MIRNHSGSETRSAFTLVELIVVILIIAILVSLIGSAVIKAMDKIPEVSTRTEITQIEVALRAFMSDYNLTNPPPSFLVLNEAAPLTGPSATFLTQVFGKSLGTAIGIAPPGVDWNGDGVINGTWTLEGEQCLVFYLGGIPSVTPQGYSMQGFSTNNMKPSMGSMLADYQPVNPLGLPPGVGMGKRKGPYYTFQTPRLINLQLAYNNPAVSPFPAYIDAWQVKKTKNLVGPMPYAYFSSNGNNNIGYLQNTAPSPIPLDCKSINALPYFLTGTTPTQYTNPNEYQIISAGKDGLFGTAGWSPTSGVPPVPPSTPNINGQPSGADDQANFSGGLLGVGQQ